MSLAVGSGQSLAGLGGWDMMYGGGVETYVDGNTADFYGYSAATSEWSTLPPLPVRRRRRFLLVLGWTSYVGRAPL